MYYVYILKSKRDNKLYIGYSGDLRRRIGEHNDGKSNSTKNRRPVVLVYYEAYFSQEEARSREFQIKNFGKAYSHLKRKISKSIFDA